MPQGNGKRITVKQQAGERRSAGDVLIAGVALEPKAIEPKLDSADAPMATDAPQGNEPATIARRGRGRPPRAEQRVRMTVSVTPELVAAYEREAVRKYGMRRRRSDVAGEALETFMKGGFGS